MAFTYPTPRRSEHVDDYHGTPVPDPYRWMEDPDDPETKAFVAASNDVTMPYLASLPEVAALRERIAELWDTPRTGAPSSRGGVTVWHHNDGVRDQPVFFVSRDGGEPEVLLDPNGLSDDGTVAVMVWSLSPDGSLLAYTLSEAGSDRQVARVLDTATGEVLPDEVRHLRFTELAWWGDGFFYSRFPDLPEGDVGLFENMSVHYHRLGDPQEEDRPVFANPEQPALGYVPEVSDDDAYLLLVEFDGTARENGLLFLPLDDLDAAPTRIVHPRVAAHQFLTHRDGRFLVLTDQDAPNGKVVAIPLDDLEAREEVIPEGTMPIELAAAAAGRLILVSLEEASHRLRLFTLDGDPDGEIALPGMGSVLEVSGRMDDPVVYMGFQSFLRPPTALRWEGGATTVFAGAEPRLDPSRVVIERRHAVSTDGAEVGMFLLRMDDTSFPAPTELYGYGGFTINITPTYDPARLAWLEAGGVVAVANLRGGTEHGEEWHRQGMLAAKQQVFDDLYACAEHLLETGVATRGTLGIRGRSNGGLLAAAALVQRPDLWGAVVPQVPVADMLRYQHFTAGRYWTVEYGDAGADPAAFEWLVRYSPLHNVGDASAYPPTLVMTAEGDDRVVPMHSLKFAATLQHAAGGSSENPLLVRVETRAGHGLGKPVSKLIDETADTFGFLLHHLRR
ncbi:MAG: prolyl oligopeptidase family serine peptidase [Actinobacteria bacterium]|nr:prolyl oligopeptidase family serine peptidase [Actinomycetota bacterium]